MRTLNRWNWLLAGLLGVTLVSEAGAVTTVIRPEPPEELPIAVEWRKTWRRVAALAALDSESAWAVGELGLVAERSSDGWTTVETGHDLEARRVNLYAVFFLDRQTGWVGGNQGTVLQTLDGGKTWTMQLDVSDVVIQHIEFLDQNRGVAYGTDLFLTEDGGKTWIQVAVEYDALSFLHQREGGLLLLDDGVVLADLYANVYRYSYSGGEIASPFELPELLPVEGRPAFRRNPKLLRLSNGTIVAYREELLFVLENDRSWRAVDIPGRVIGIGGIRGTDSVWLLTRGGVHLGSLQNASWERAEWLDDASGGELFVAGEPLRAWRLRAYRVFSTREGQSPAEDYGPEATGFERYPGGFEPVEDFESVHRWTTTGPPERLRVFGALDGYEQGGVVVSEDRGRTWSLESLPAVGRLAAGHCTPAGDCWAVGYSGEILRLQAGKWGAVDSPTEENLAAVFSISADEAWVGGLDGLFQTRDAGKSWVHHWPKEDGWEDPVSGISFMEPDRGWVSLLFGKTLVSTDRGDSWSLVTPEGFDRGPGGTIGLMFTTLEQGLLMTDAGLYTTTDGGLSWNPMVIPALRANGERVISLASANRHSSWALGSEGTLAMTTDGGTTWRVREPAGHGALPESEYVDETSGLVWIGAGAEGEVLLLGDGGLDFTGAPVAAAPVVSELEVESAPTGHSLTWQVEHSDLESVIVERIEFRSEGSDDWSTLDELDVLKESETPLTPDAEGRFHLRWDPYSPQNAAPKGTDLYFRFTHRGEDGLEFAHEIAEPVPMVGFFEGLHPWVRKALWGAAAVVGYALLALLLVLIWPRGVRKLYAHLPVDAVESQGPIAFLLRGLIKGTLLPLLVKHPRARRAFLQGYRKGAETFTELPDELRSAYLEEPDCLDAWVEARMDSARTTFFDRIDTVRQRQIFVPLPMRLEEEDGELVSEALPSHFPSLQGSGPGVGRILGRGGAGKSTLACQLAHWAFDGRFFGHPAIAVFVEEDLDDLPATVRRLLVALVGQDEVTPEIVHALLRGNRLLVIVDALSERTSNTASAVLGAIRDLEVPRVLVTTRRPVLELGAIPTDTVCPQPLDPHNLVYFLTEYLLRQKMDQVFPGEDLLTLGSRLLRLVKRSEGRAVVTPLLVKLFVESAVAAVRDEKGCLDDLPSTPAGVMLDYLKGVNPQGPEVPNRLENRRMIRAARVLGQVSLARSLQPQEFFRDGAEAALAEEGFDRPDAVVDRLLENGVLLARESAGSSLLRFEFDPLAEYLAALYYVDRFRGDTAKWKDFVEASSELPGYPSRQIGFLLAVEDATRTFGKDFGTPAVSFPRVEAA